MQLFSIYIYIYIIISIYIYIILYNIIHVVIQLSNVFNTSGFTLLAMATSQAVCPRKVAPTATIPYHKA